MKEPLKTFSRHQCDIVHCVGKQIFQEIIIYLFSEIVKKIYFKMDHCELSYLLLLAKRNPLTSDCALCAKTPILIVCVPLELKLRFI